MTRSVCTHANMAASLSHLASKKGVQQHYGVLREGMFEEEIADVTEHRQYFRFEKPK